MVGIDGQKKVCRIVGKKERKKMSCPDPLYDYEDFIDYENGYDPIMGDEWIETDDEWLDDFQGEEEFA
jgi:hypothetical protein